MLQPQQLTAEGTALSTQHLAANTEGVNKSPALTLIQPRVPVLAGVSVNVQLSAVLHMMHTTQELSVSVPEGCFLTDATLHSNR